jgi:hypothetical protein
MHRYLAGKTVRYEDLSNGDTEVTFVEVRTLREIRSRCLVDWSMLGMIMQVLVP